MKSIKSYRFLIFILLSQSLQSQITSSTGYSAENIVADFVGDGVLFDNAFINCYDLAIGKFDCVDCNVGLDSGIIFTTGRVINITGPNEGGSAGNNNFWPGDADLDVLPGVGTTYDACVFEFDAFATGDTLSFDYVFGSEEFPEWVGFVNDAFVFLISGPGFVSPKNLAVYPGTDIRITIDNLYGGPYYISNGCCGIGVYATDPYYIEYDGFTTVLNARAAISAGEWYHLKFVIADAYDATYDSGIFLKSKSFNFNCTPSPELCNTLDDNCNGLIDDGITETIIISAAGPTTFCQGGSLVLSAIYSGATVQWQKNGANIPGAISSTYTATKKGNYTCVTTSSCDTVTSSGIFVNVLKNPAASISAGGATTFCAGGSVTLTEVPSGGCTYQWYKGVSAIGGATSTNYIATTTGNYKCRVTKAATGCYKNSNAIAVSVPCRESESSMVNGESGFTIYPNPANDKLFISITSLTTHNSPLNTDHSLILITDLEGRIIYNSQLNSPTTEINISDFASGMYFVKVIPIPIAIGIEGEERIEKFIKN